MGLNTHNLINYGGGGGNQLNTGPLSSNLVVPLPGDFLVYIICWQAGDPLGGYIPVQPAFSVFDDAGQNWQNLFDVFGLGPGGVYNSQYSMSVWFCPRARGGQFNISTSGTAVPLLQDSEGHGSLLDWRLDNRASIITASKFDASNTANPTLPSFNVLANQLIIGAFYSPNVAPTKVSISPGYTEIDGFGTTVDYTDIYIARPTDTQNTPAMITTAPIPFWLMAGLQIDISPPSLGIGQIDIPDYQQMEIER